MGSLTRSINIAMLSWASVLSEDSYSSELSAVAHRPDQHEGGAPTHYWLPPDLDSTIIVGPDPLIDLLARPTLRDMDIFGTVSSDGVSEPDVAAPVTPEKAYIPGWNNREGESSHPPVSHPTEHMDEPVHHEVDKHEAHDVISHPSDKESEEPDLEAPSKSKDTSSTHPLSHHVNLTQAVNSMLPSRATNVSLGVNVSTTGSPNDIENEPHSTLPKSLQKHTIVTQGPTDSNKLSATKSSASNQGLHTLSLLLIIPAVIAQR